MLSPSDYAPERDREAERLAAVQSYERLAAEERGGFEQITRLAQSLFHVPIALVTTVGEETQCFLDKQGLEGSGTPRDQAFCAWTILSDEPLVVEDALEDERFRCNPLVTDGPRVRFYAGVPLTVSEGVRVGALCLLDHQPRRFSSDDLLHLRLLGDLTVAELRRASSSAQLKMSQALSRQTARLTRTGSWQLELATGDLSWTAESHRIFGLPLSQKPNPSHTVLAYAPAHRALMARSFGALLSEGKPYDVEVEINAFDGQTRWLRCIADAEIVDGVVVRAFGSTQDLTERHAQDARIEEMAYHDALTGLANRVQFARRLSDTVDAAQMERAPCGLVIIDLDHFKDVNDTLGHDAGDALLCTVADRMRAVVRASDTVARLGGDEFAVVLPGVRDGADVMRLAEKVRLSLAQPLIYDGKRIAVSASLGAVVLVDGNEAPKQLLKNADIALYEAKSAGRNTVVLFEPRMRARVEARSDLLRRVRAGLDAGEFELHFQPIVSIASRDVVGFEGLMRWRDAERGLLTPAVFYDAFEDPELSLRLGEVALENAMKRVREWRAAGVQFGRVAVNLSSAQFRNADLAAHFAASLANWDVPAEAFIVEITETVYMGWGSQIVADTARELRKLGVQVALDDFGTGYASLANLRQLPIDLLKIDKSFLEDAADSPLVRTVIDLGRRMGVKVVAEGVEDPRQLEILASLGCDKAQGYLFSAAMPARDVAPYLSAFRADLHSQKAA